MARITDFLHLASKVHHGPADMDIVDLYGSMVDDSELLKHLQASPPAQPVEAG